MRARTYVHVSERLFRLRLLNELLKMLIVCVQKVRSNLFHVVGRQRNYC